MEGTPSSGHCYHCSPNPSDSSEGSQKTISGNLAIPNVGHHDQQEVNSGRVASLVGEEDGTSDSERTASFSHIRRDGHGDVVEVDSGHCKAGDQDIGSEAKGKSVYPGHHQEVTILQGKKGGLLKVLLPKNSKVVCGTGDDNILSKNTEMDGETGDGKIPLTETKMVPLLRVGNRTEQLPVPKWLKDYKSDVADLEGWQHMQKPRDDYSGRKDKFYSHKDYSYTFRSKNEVKEFLDTGKVKGKELRKKKSADPGRQSSGPRHSTKRRMVLHAGDAIEKPQGFGWSTRGEIASNSSTLPHGFV